MGDNADRLGETLDADPRVVYDAGVDLSGYTTDVEETAKSLRTIGSETGLNGASADAAADRFLALSREVARISDAIVGVAQGGDRAAAAIEAAQQAFHALPSGELTLAERARFTLGTTAMFPTPAGTVTGVVAGELLSQQRERERESKARQALADLDQAMADVTFEAVQARDSGVDDPRTGADGPSVPGGTGTRSVPSTWQPSVGGSDGGRPVGTTPATTTGAVSASWQPADQNGAGIGGWAGGGSGSAPGTTGGQVSPGWPGTGSGGGSGIGGGHVPGAGDGSSSDGVVGGTVPGGSGSGGGSFAGVPGGSGGAGSGSSGLGGLGAGGLAGGLMVGGAALGGASLNRLAGGGVGATGGGGVGAVGGMGGGGSYGVGASAGAAGAGSSGSTLTGTSSGSALGQGSQAGAAGAGAAGQRAGGMMGGPMGGGAGGAAGGSQSKRRGSSGLLAPDIAVEDGAQRHDLGAGAGAGGRDALSAPVVARAEQADDEW